jgi:predicted enzyme related to lactoylglutathione lyase
MRVSGIDAVMIYADDAAALSKWYSAHLGITTRLNPADGNYYAEDAVCDTQTGHQVRFGIYVVPHAGDRARHAVMINYRVDDFDAALGELRASGILPTEIVEEPYGWFAYFKDPEGNPIEIWSPRRPDR